VNRLVFLSFVYGLVFVAWNCTNQSSNDTSSNGDIPGVSVGVVGGEGGGGVVIADPSETAGQPSNQPALCPMDNLTRQCTCNSETGPVMGKQVCYASRGWAPCECFEVPSTIITNTDDTPVPDPVVNKGPEHFDWNRTIPSGGECLAGHYKGEFAGQYSPAPIQPRSHHDFWNIRYHGDGRV
jgi:hypothetical protein